MASNGPARTDSNDDGDKTSSASNSKTATNLTTTMGDCSAKSDSEDDQEKHDFLVDTRTRPPMQSLSDAHLNHCHIGCVRPVLVSGTVSLPCMNSTTDGNRTFVRSNTVDASETNITQSTSEAECEPCDSPGSPGNEIQMNGELPVGVLPMYVHNSGIVSSQTNSLSATKSVPVGSQVVHVNGSVSHNLSTDENFDHVVPNTESTADQSDQCQKGARPKKLRKRPRRDDRHSKTNTCGAVQSDSDDDDYNSHNGIPLAIPNVMCSKSVGETKSSGQCNGMLPQSRLSLTSPLTSHGQLVNNRSERLGAAVLPVSPQRDEDLVDEGAVCDFDRNVLADENLFYTEDTSIPSPVDGANEESLFPNRHTSYSNDHPLLQYRQREGQRYFSPHRCYNLSDSEEDVYRHATGRAVGHGGQVNRDNADEDVEDNGDFIDTDLPMTSGPLMSSSADSASLSSANGDLAESGPAPTPGSRECMSSKQENDLSGGSDKELNRKQSSPSDLRTYSDSAMFRTSYSSPSHDGGFDNFLLPRDLSSSDGVFWNSSESENEDELSEEVPQEQQNGSDAPGPPLEGAGVAEALVTSPPNDEGVGEQPFGAGGDLAVCFHFDRACCLQDNQWPTASCVPHTVLAGHSASRHCPHLPTGLALEGEAGGACAPPAPVNNLSRLHPATPGLRPGEAIANGLDDVAPSNFINDESNRQQKVFDKFPMVEEGREGACGSSAGQNKCDNDNVLYSCPVAPAPGIPFDRQGDRAALQDQGSLEPNVDSFSRMRLPDFNYRSLFRGREWRANSESGVSEPVLYEENYGYRWLCPCTSPDCLTAHNPARQLSLNKGGKVFKKKRIVCRPIENGVDPFPSVERMMIWSEYEAYLLQVKQIGMSACGQTAILNLLKAFDVTAEKEDVCNTIQVNLRKEKASVADYLASRAVAGTTAEDLLSGVERLTKGDIRGRFFQLWPPRNIQLLTWLSQWMKRGAVPIATLNLQQGVKQQQQIPDAWHHQMVYGVGPKGVYLTNPLEIVSEDTMMEQLTSDSVLLVRRQDVVSRFQASASLAPLLHHPDPRWCSMNVLGQVVNVLREHNMPSVPGYRAQVTSHIRIPAVYRAGVTLYARHNTAQWKALRSAPDLPLLSSAEEPQLTSLCADRK